MHGAGEACALSSGTASLALALRGLGIGPDMAVAVPSYSCSALLNAVYWVGARPLVVDVTLDSFVLDPAGLPGQVEAIVVVHTYGAAAPIEAYRNTGAKIIEDCCQSLGGRSDGRPLGEQGDAAVYSFYATKIISGGQGGLVWSSDASCVPEVRATASSIAVKSTCPASTSNSPTSRRVWQRANWPGSTRSRGAEQSWREIMLGLCQSVSASSPAR